MLARVTDPAAVTREATWAALVLTRFGVLGRGSGKTSLQFSGFMPLFLVE